MKKITKTILALSLCAVFLLLPITADAKSITSLTASASGNKISVSGTAQSGTLACVVTVYDQSGTTMIDMESFATKSDSSFSYTLDSAFANGTYVVKVADYDGGAFAKVTVTVSGSGTVPGTIIPPITIPTTGDNATAVTAPKTGDSSSILLLGLIMVSSLAVVGATLFVKKEK